MEVAISYLHITAFRIGISWAINYVEIDFFVLALLLLHLILFYQIFCLLF